MPPAIFDIRCTRPAEGPIPWALLASVATLHDRQVCRLSALEYPAGVDAYLTIDIRWTLSVAHQSADLGMFAVLIYGGNRMARRQLRQLDTAAEQERASGRLLTSVAKAASI